MRRVTMKRLVLLIFCAGLFGACGQKYQDLLDKGKADREHQNWAAAKQHLFLAAEKQHTAEVYKELGNVFLLGEQNIAEAENYYRKALVEDPTYINAQFNMAVVNIRKYEQTLDDSGRGDDALLNTANSWFTKVYTQNPSFTVGIEELAKYYIYRRDYKKALETVEKAISVNSRNSHAYSIAGQIYYIGLKDYKLAFENFEQARSLDNKDADVVYFLWATSEKLKKTADATQFKTRYEQMLKHDGMTSDQAKERVKRLENQLKG
jgi:tetratricopeptide (TPR) repeat protein